ncbi:uncharacterized protein PHACADRAFT_260786 [Phanerochaete carnosa HHB-10118-sp]|uniref:Sugar phosphate phosphatase n=1 Tax=Phanerochaete carnosa (strain HHB-10118-sp) TaxID=650164 RepID=K5W0M3_PHACS|nr:uncharacterized protein PHACADRAFT_260786 [Phanerochaete carnosa HHB-10118-sp]EKM52419.1 hypothetical protein PHACADRAFT_260786 [Phanerochaete carnosa HHB-10118-sp]
MFESPFPPYDPTDRSGFSYETVVKRWPIILTGIIDMIYQLDHEIGVSLHTLPASNEETINVEEKIKEGKSIIEKVGKLKYDMARDRALELIPHDGEAYIEEYNVELDKLAQNKRNTWFTAPWLFAECYLYRLLRSFFTQTTHWRDFDPFSLQKQETFRSSGKAIYQLATTIHELEVEKDVVRNDPAKLAVLFKEMIQMCLWGNATDLSLLTHMSHDDIATLQTVGKDAQAARREFILKDDQDKVIKYLEDLKGKDARVDFVLDNAGFELFTDFVFADFLVTYTPYVSRVVFHPKLIPWFVSDVTPPDFASTIPSLHSESFFPEPKADATARDTAATLPNADVHQHLKTMVARWQSYLDSGVFSLSVRAETKLGEANDKANFWTGPWPYWNMRELAPQVWSDLKDSSLVVFKGDLNYRKLTGDVSWPVSTPFEEAVGPLAGDFPILSLRTNKADVVVGVPQDVADKLDAAGEKWRVNGKYALVSFLPRRV